MDPHTIQTLRDHLFAELADLRDKTKPPELERAKAIVDLSGQIIATGRLEVDYLKVFGSDHGTGFVPVDNHPSISGPGHSAHQQIVSLPGGTITTHRIR